MENLPQQPFDQDLQQIEAVRARFEPQLLAIDGVVAVSAGYDEDGQACLKIGTSVPAEDVRPHLPEELSQVNVELEFYGDITTQ